MVQVPISVSYFCSRVLLGPLASGSYGVILVSYLNNCWRIIHGTIKLQENPCSLISQMRLFPLLILASLALAAPHLEKRLDLASRCGQWEYVK